MNWPEDEFQEGLASSMVALCRCGGSQNKPLRDGTHRKKGFEAAGATVNFGGATG